MSVPATEQVVPPSGLGSLMPTQSTTSADKDMFLQLLVAQLRYQDPTNPTDTSAFLAQSAQFTALEKMQDVADRTTMLLGAQLAFGASSLVGRDVTYTLPDGTDGAGRVRSVTFGADGPVLDVDGVEVPVALVQTVGDTTGATGTPATPQAETPETPDPTVDPTP